MSKSRKPKKKNRYYIYFAIRDGELIEIVTPFLFDYSVSKKEAEETCLWWLNKQFPNDEFEHTTQPGLDFENRIIGWTLKLDTHFTLKDKKIEGIRRIEPITHFEGMCKQ